MVAKAKIRAKSTARPTSAGARKPASKVASRPASKVVTCGDVMTRQVITASPEDTLSELCRLLAEDDISGAPVVDHRGVVVGIVSKTDVLRSLLSGRQAPGLPSATMRFLGLTDTMAGMAEDSEEEAFGQVADCMTPDVESVTRDTPITRAAMLMSSKRIHRVVVMDNGKVVGIITSLDLLKRFAK